jgi:hypothetical protein
VKAYLNVIFRRFFSGEFVRFKIIYSDSTSVEGIKLIVVDFF